MTLLFEYGQWKPIKNTIGLKPMLQDIWKQKLFADSENELDDEAKDKRYQPFLKFGGKSVRANNFVGYIQHGDELIEIYPKVFRDKFPNPTDEERMLFLRHIFYWFSYCRKWKFPFNKASLDTIDIVSFPELIINLIANQFFETLSNHPLTMYQQVEETLQTPRGSINFGRYINSSLSKGNFQNIECDYEPFLFDNKVNRIIKYCARLLMGQTKFPENLRILQDIVFVLDEVEDMPCTIHDIDKTNFNSFFDEYALIMDSCRLILNQQLYSNNTYDLSQWCLLFPMEYIFEDFFAGFLEEHFSKEWKVHYQKSDLNLSNNPSAFNMQHDIYLTNKTGKKIIVDTKYKLRENNYKSDIKKGIAQNDLYQMVSYAFKRGCTDVILVYPNLSEEVGTFDKFEIDSGFEGKEKINIYSIEIPFWSELGHEVIDERLRIKIAEILEII